MTSRLFTPQMMVVVLGCAAACTVPPYRGGLCTFTPDPAQRAGCRTGLSCQPDAGCAAAGCVPGTVADCPLASGAPGQVLCASDGTWPACTAVPCAEGQVSGCRLPDPRGALYGESRCVDGGLGACAETAATACARTVGVCVGARRLFDDLPGCSALSYLALDSGYLDDECRTRNDGVDNNCNGVADEVDPGDGGFTLCPLQAGACRGAYLRCGGGARCADQDYASMDAGYAPDELCGDGIDNECNGVVDDRIGPERVVTSAVAEVAVAGINSGTGATWRIAWVESGPSPHLRSQRFTAQLAPISGVLDFGPAATSGQSQPVLLHTGLNGGHEVAAWRASPARLCVASAQPGSVTQDARSCFDTSRLTTGPRLVSFTNRTAMLWVESDGGLHLATAVPGADGGDVLPQSAECAPTGPVDCLNLHFSQLSLVGADLTQIVAAEQLPATPQRVYFNGLKEIETCSCGVDTCLTNFCLGPATFDDFDGGTITDMAIAPWNGTAARTVLAVRDATPTTDLFIRRSEGDGGYVQQVSLPSGVAAPGPIAIAVPETRGGDPLPPLGAAGVPLLAYQGASHWYVQLGDPAFDPDGGVAVADAFQLTDGGINRPGLASAATAPYTAAFAYVVPLADAGTELRARVLCLPAKQ